MSTLALDTRRILEPGVEDGVYGPATPVPIYQHEWEFSKLLELYRLRMPNRVLEVGTYYGGTLYHWLTHIRPAPELVVAVDSYAVGVDNRHLYPEWTDPETELVVIEGDSRAPETVAKVRELAPFDWVWIDAGHYYPEVADDFRNYGPLVKRGGVVAFHDILPPSAQHPEIEVARLWAEIQRAGYVTQEIVRDPRNSWGGIGVVYA